MESRPPIASPRLGTAGVCFALFTAAFLFYTLAWPDAPITKTDTLDYLDAAADLKDFEIDQFQGRPPGFPLLLLITGSADAPKRALFVAQLLMSFGSIGMLAWILARSGLPAAATLLFVLVMLTPPLMQTAAFALSEVTATFLITSGFLALFYALRRDRPSLLALASMLFGAAALTRPSFLLLGPLLAAPTAAFYLRGLRLDWKNWRRPLLVALLLIGPSSAVVGSYWLYNGVRFGRFSVTPYVGYNLAVRTTYLYEDLEDEVIRDILIEHRSRALAAGENVYWTVYFAGSDLKRATGLSQLALGERLKELCLEVIKKRPIAYLKDAAGSFAEIWFPYVTELPLVNSTLGKAFGYTLQFLIMSAFFVVTLANIGGTLAYGGFSQLDRALVVAFVCALLTVFSNAAVSSLLDFGETRQRVATDPLIVWSVFAGGWLWLRRPASAFDQGRVAELGSRAKNQRRAYSSPR